MIKYSIDIKLKIQVADEEEKHFDYVEKGEGLVDDLEEALDMFVKPRFEADGKILIGLAKKELL